MTAFYDTHYMATLLASLPSYTAVVFTTIEGKQLKGIARDMPGTTPRRYTVEGWEWFIDADFLAHKGARSDIAQVEVQELTVALG